MEEPKSIKCGGCSEVYTKEKYDLLKFLAANTIINEKERKMIIKRICPCNHILEWTIKGERE